METKRKMSTKPQNPKTPKPLICWYDIIFKNGQSDFRSYREDRAAY